MEWQIDTDYDVGAEVAWHGRAWRATLPSRNNPPDRHMALTAEGDPDPRTFIDSTPAWEEIV